MEVSEHVAALRREGELLAAAAERTGLDAPIPTCPGWRTRDLVRHIGDVHRWARAHVAEGRLKPIGPKDLPEVAGPLPEDDQLLEWFRQGHVSLVRTLETADPSTECRTFLPAPSPVAFWARRQAHETGIHRADAEGPGFRVTAFPPAFAADGVDELLFGFLSRANDGLGTDAPRSLHLHATDADGEWLVRIGLEATEVTRQHEKADCAVRGPASDLYLLLWNRRPPDGLNVQGDQSVLDFWRDTVQITWSRGR